jgi:hypothetical protein
VPLPPFSGSPLINAVVALPEATAALLHARNVAAVFV